MGNTFGGEHRRPRDDGRGHTRRELEDRASYDNQPSTSYSGCLLIALTLCAAIATVLGLAVT